jgi:preprotein translocase subunit SecD
MNEVRASLADDARLAAIRSTVVGSALVVLFMVGYYLSGVIAVIALVANVVILGVQQLCNQLLHFLGCCPFLISMAVD